MLLRHVQRDDLAIRWERYRFGDTQQDPHRDQHGEAVNESGCGGGGRPEDERGRQHPVHVVAINNPAADDLGGAVGPEESGEEKAKLGGGNMQFVFQQRRCNRKINAVDIVDQNREEEQAESTNQRAASAAIGRHNHNQPSPQVSAILRVIRGEHKFKNVAVRCFAGPYAIGLIKDKMVISGGMARCHCSDGMLPASTSSPYIRLREHTRLRRPKTNLKMQWKRWQASPPFEIASVLVRLDHVTGFIVNANHSIM